MVKIVNTKAKVLAELFPELTSSYTRWQSWNKMSIDPRYTNPQAAIYGQYAEQARDEYYEACNRFVELL